MAEYGVWLLAASLVVLVLAAVAIRLLWRLREQTQRENRERAEYERGAAEQGLEARQGISILARSYVGGQLGASELALRVAVLAEAAQVEVAFAEDTAVFTEMAAALAHIPTHRDWKALSSEQRATYSAEMALLEASYSDKIHTAAGHLCTLR